MNDDEVLNLDTITDFGALGVGLDDLESEDVTLVSYVLDASGSMGPHAADVVAAFGAEIAAMAGARTADQVLVSVTVFQDVARLCFGYRKLADVPRLDAGLYAPDGCTALFDAAYGALAHLDGYRAMLRDSGVRSRGVVLVMTDGEDNASRRRADEVKALAARLSGDEGLVLAYVGFGGDGAAQAAQAAALGFPTVLTTALSAGEIRRVLGQVSRSVLRTGARAPASFF